MQPELNAAIVQDATDGRVLMLAWMDAEAERLHARDRRGVVLEPLAAGSCGARARRRGTRSRSRRSATTATATRCSLRVRAGRPGMPHRLALVLRARALADDRGARARSGPRARTSRRSSTPGVAAMRAKGRGGGGGGERRRRRGRPRAGSSTRPPTSSSTCTSCSPPPAWKSPRSRTSSRDERSRVLDVSSVALTGDDLTVADVWAVAVERRAGGRSPTRRAGRCGPRGSSSSAPRTARASTPTASTPASAASSRSRSPRS